MNIPQAAVDAAAKAAYILHSNAPGFDAEAAWDDMGGTEDWERGQWDMEARAALEAALPHMLSHEREQTRLAHVDAVVNAESLSKYETLVDELKYTADNNTFDDVGGQWWAEVIHGAVVRHIK